MEDLFPALSYTVKKGHEAQRERGKNENSGSGSEDHTGYPHV